MAEKACGCHLKAPGYDMRCEECGLPVVCSPRDMMAPHRPEDRETPTVEAAAGFEAYYGTLGGDDDRVLDARDARRDAREDERHG